MACLDRQDADASVWPGVGAIVPVRVLGGGGGGTVWGCLDGGVPVAVKIATPSPRFAREALAQRQLGSPAAPALVRCATADDGRAAIVMEWLAGDTLAARLASGGGRWPFAELGTFAAALAARIDETHAAGIAHRDLKPTNIWLDPDGTIRLIDFGLALLDDTAIAISDDDASTTRGDVIGTPLYMAPEQALGEPSGRAADIYSYGAILFELVAGQPPFAGADLRVAHASRRAPAVSSHAPHAAMLDDVIAACLAKRPEDRPRTAGEVARAIASCGAASATAVTAPRAKSAPSTIALLGIPSTTIDLHAIATATTAASGMVARARPDGFVVAFPGIPPTAGVARARALAATLGVTATVHVAELAIQRGVRGTRVTGGAIDDADTWWNAGITTEAAAYAESTRAPAADVAVPRAPSIGRDAEVAAIVALVREAVAANEPAIVSIVGDAGVGTSRVLEDAIAQLAPLPVVRVGTTVPELAEPTLVVVDAAHRVDAGILDALEQAASNGDPIVVLVAAQPVLFRRRPLWSDRVPRALRIDLAPLDRATTTALLRALLAPVEYIAEPALAALATLADGNPGHAVEVVRQLHAVGAIRTATGGGTYLAADELLQVSATELARQLAHRVLARLAPDVRRFAQIAAILDEDLEPRRLEQIREAVGDEVEIDGGVALARLVAAQIVVERDDRWCVRHALLGDAIVETLPPAERADLHRAALAYVPAGDLAARARHAKGAGETGLAGTALAELGDTHRAARRDVDAERAYSSALDHLVDPTARAHALFGRGIVRYRLQRLGDADADLAAAELLVDGDRLAEVRLERATVADWSERWDDEARIVQSIEAGTPVLQARLQMARGRAAFRAGDLDAARVDLAAAAETELDRETRVIAKLLLGAVLVTAGDVDAAHVMMDATVAECEAAHDKLHQCAALNNRMWLWIKRDQLDRGIEDQRAATALAHEIGHAHVERSSTYNLAELLHWRGSFDEALPLALRSRSLQSRFLGPSPLDALLVARIQAARDEHSDVERELAWIDAACGDLTGALAMQRTVIGLVATTSADRTAWEGALAAARETTVLYELVEALWFASRTAARVGDAVAATRWISEARALGHPSWNERFVALEGGMT